jgi:acyl-CoA thioesterase I
VEIGGITNGFAKFLELSMHYFRHFFALVLCLTVSFTCNANASEKPIQIVAFGTSFTNGKGVFQSNAWPAKLEKKLNEEGLNVQLSNEGKNGDTTVDLKSRLNQAIPEGTSVVLLEYAIGNDKEAGIRFPEMAQHVDEMVSALVTRNIQVLLIIRAGENPKIIEVSKFRFKRLVKQFGILTIFVEQPPESLLSDGRHPTEQAHTEIAASLVAPVRELISRARATAK